MNINRLIFVWGIYMLCLVSTYAQHNKKDGDFYAKVNTYDRAIKYYLRELKKFPEDTKLLMKIVDCYLESDLDRSESLPYIEKIWQDDKTVQHTFKYAKSLFYSKYFDEAIEHFEWIKKNAEAESEEYKQSGVFLKWILNAQAYTNKPVDVDFINLGKNINTVKSELNPYVTDIESKLVFSSNKKYNSKNGNNYYNISIAHRVNNKWQKGKRINSDINSSHNEIVAGYSSDGENLLVFHDKNGEEKLAYSKFEGKNSFEPIEDFDYPVDRKGKEFGAFYSSERDTLYFASQDENNHTDIYYSLMLPMGYYGEPRPIKGLVNTEYDEDFPVLSKDGKRLYFSSNGESSMGGYDLFYSDWDENKKQWSKPVNMGYPINDLYDNYNISFGKSSRYAYVSALRRDGYGERDIYKVVFNDKNPGNTILKCKVIQETDTGKIVPVNDLRIELQLEGKKKIVGRYRCSSDSAKFVMALSPGKYIVTAKSKKELVKSWMLEVPEIWYSNIPDKKEFIIPKKKTDK